MIRSQPAAVLKSPQSARRGDLPAVRRPLDECMLSVVLPLFDEVAVLRELLQRVEAVVQECGCRYEIIFVNDGSRDGSGELLDEMAAENPAVKVLHFSRNFGHQAAVQAGLSYARGDAVIVMDSDLQDDPQAIADFVRQWQNGYDVVYAVRHSRKEHPLKRLLFHAFYRVLNCVSRTRMPMDAGNFGLLDRRVAREIVSVIDCDRYFPGLRSWVGFRQIGVPVERGRRHDENPRVSIWGLFRLAKTAIFSFSAVPLTFFYVIALLSLVTCAGVTLFTLYHKLVTGLALPGWTSITIVASFFGALNALGIGVLGEYAIRIYDQVRARPQFIVARAVNVDAPLAELTDPQARASLEWLAEHWAPATAAQNSTAAE